MSGKNSNSNTIANSMAWAFGERIAAQLVTTLVTIVLARLLQPEAYGMISIVTVSISLLNVFVTSGIGTALVQRKEADETDFNTAFALSFVLAMLLYVGLFIVTPWIARFYALPQLTPVIRVMGLRLPLAAMSNIQHAHIQRAMRFQKVFLSSFIGALVSGILGIACAKAGAGVWALVVQYLVSSLVATAVLFVVGSWRPRLQFSWQRAKSIWSFGWKVLVTQLIATAETDIKGLIIGKVFGSSDLAFFDQGKKYPALIITNVNSTIDKVMLPAFSKQQDDRQALLALLRKTIRIGVFTLVPLILGFAMVSESFVVVVLGEKWRPCIPFLQIACMAYLGRPVETSCRQALLAVGKSGIVMVSVAIINVCSLVCTVIAVFAFESILLIALTAVLAMVISLTCFLGFTMHTLGYSLKAQLADILPGLFAGLVMCGCVFGSSLLITGSLLGLIVQIVTGMLSYLLIAALLKLEAYQYYLGILKRLLKRRRGTSNDRQ